jgi:hypothetical protein
MKCCAITIRWFLFNLLKFSQGMLSVYENEDKKASLNELSNGIAYICLREVRMGM